MQSPENYTTRFCPSHTPTAPTTTQCEILSPRSSQQLPFRLTLRWNQIARSGSSYDWKTLLSGASSMKVFCGIDASAATLAVTVSRKRVTRRNQTARMALSGALRNPWERLLCPYCAFDFEAFLGATSAHTRQRSDLHRPLLNFEWCGCLRLLRMDEKMG